MTYHSPEIVTPPARLPITVVDAQADLARAVVEEIEHGVLWRAIVAQERRIVIHGPLPPKIEMEPVTALTSLTRWTPSDPAAVIDAASYYYVSSDPAGAIIAPAPGFAWPEPERSIGSFALTYMAGWVVSDTENAVPASVKLMVERAIEYRAGGAGGDIRISGLEMDKPDSYQTDQLPRALTDIARAFFYRPGIFAARP